jgi:very-short-patch-repair endonuclease
MPVFTTTQLARDLRSNQTDVERELWFVLRDRRFQNYKFRRQFSIPPYIVDFCCVEKKLVVELDGGQHAVNVEKDLERKNYIENKGYVLIRFWNNEVLENKEGIMIRILETLESL